jgi:hypothetical protein
MGGLISLQAWQTHTQEYWFVVNMLFEMNIHFPMAYLVWIATAVIHRLVSRLAKLVVLRLIELIILIVSTIRIE